MNFVSNFEESNFELEFEFVFRGTGFDGQSDGSKVSLKKSLAPKSIFTIIKHFFGAITTQAIIKHFFGAMTTQGKCFIIEFSLMTVAYTRTVGKKLTLFLILQKV